MSWRLARPAMNFLRNLPLELDALTTVLGHRPSSSEGPAYPVNSPPSICPEAAAHSTTGSELHRRQQQVEHERDRQPHRRRGSSVAHAFLARQIAVIPAKDRHRQLRRTAFRRRLQSPPDTRRINNADAAATLKQTLNDILGSVGLARPGLAENGQVPLDHGIEHIGRVRRLRSPPPSTAGLCIPRTR
jgi:hypothetical protein